MKNLYINGNPSTKNATTIRCQFCGHEVTARDFANGNVIHGPYAYGGGEVYAHKDCLDIREHYYGWSWQKYIDSGRVYHYNKANKSGRWHSVEWETDTPFDFQTALKMVARHGLAATQDCTVEVEWQTRPVSGCWGCREKYSALLADIGDITDNCGSHMNSSTEIMRGAVLNPQDPPTEWRHDETAMRKILRNYEELFGGLRRALRADREKCRRVFGRYFGDWARSEERPTEHSCWMAVRFDSEDHRNCLEFRLPRMTNLEAAVNTTFFMDEVLKFLDRFLKDEIPAKTAGRGIAREYEKISENKAQFQKRAR